MIENTNLTGYGPVNFFPGQQLRERMDAYCRETGLTISELARRAVSEYIESRAPSAQVPPAPQEQVTQ
jgi:hypothetical protein